MAFVLQPGYPVRHRTKRYVMQVVQIHSDASGIMVHLRPALQAPLVFSGWWVWGPGFVDAFESLDTRLRPEVV